MKPLKHVTNKTSLSAWEPTCIFFQWYYLVKNDTGPIQNSPHFPYIDLK